MDTSAIVAFSGTATALVVGTLAIVKVLVDRHLGALTRLEARAEANTDVLNRVALAFDVVRDTLTAVLREVGRGSRDTQRIADHLGIPDTRSVPMPAPAEIPRSATITGQHAAWTVDAAGGHDRHPQGQR